jgi:uncharacterized protein YjbI with pentapeptide repeats
MSCSGSGPLQVRCCQPKPSGANLSGVSGLSGTILDGADLGCASGPQGQALCTQLIDTDLNGASFKKAILADAELNGANLSLANLTEADLSGAQLLKSPYTQQSATLEGAMLKNANLSSADLSGSNLTNVNWYSTSAATSCPGSTWAATCASGQGAVLNSADLAAAYLSGLDLSDSTPQGADFAGAVLVGASFKGAKLNGDPTIGALTNFENVFLQGANFENTVVTGASFTSAYVDLSSSGATLLLQLPVNNLEFTGYEQYTGSIKGCVEFSYSNATTVPATDSTDSCPDSKPGPCTDTQWQSPKTPIEDATPQSTTDISAVLSSGWSFSTLDRNRLAPSGGSYLAVL